MGDSDHGQSVGSAAEPSPRDPLCARETAAQQPAEAVAQAVAEMFGRPRAFLAAVSGILGRLEAGERLSDEEHAQTVAQLHSVRTFLNSHHHRTGGKLLGRRRAKTPRELEVLTQIRAREGLVS